MSVWRRLQRIGKKAAKFQYTISLQELCIECSPHYKPSTLVVVWSRRSRRYVSKPIECQQSEENQTVCNHVWSMPENIEFTTTLYRGEKALQYEEKEWICQVEELSKASQARIAAPTMRRRVLATRQIELSEFASGIPTQTSLKITLRLASKKLISATLLITLHSLMLKEGDATDEDMISLASVMSLSRAGSFNVGSGLTVNDVGGIGSMSPSFRRFCSSRFPPGYANKLTGSVGGTSSFHTDLSKLTAKLQALQRVPDENESETDSGIREKEQTSENNSSVQPNSKPSPDGVKAEDKPQTLQSAPSLPNVSDSNPSSIRDSKTTGGRSGQDLLEWCQEVTRDYPSIQITNLTTSFQSGLAFCAILHHHHPDKIDLDVVKKSTPVDNCRLAFDVASKLGIPRVLDPIEVTSLSRSPDLLSMMTYLHQMRMHFCGPPSSPKLIKTELSAGTTRAIQENGSVPRPAQRRASSGSEQVLTKSLTPETRRRTSETVQSKLVQEAPPELAVATRKSSLSLRYDHMVSKARHLLEQTRSQQQLQATNLLPYTDALPPLANARKPRPHSTFAMPTHGISEKDKPSSETEGKPETPRHASTSTICVPNGTTAPPSGSTTSTQSSPSKKPPQSSSSTSPDGVKVLHLKLSQLNLFASGRGTTAPVPIRIGEHHFGAKTPDSPSRILPQHQNAKMAFSAGKDLHKINTGEYRSMTVQNIPSTTSTQQPTTPSLSNYIANEQAELDRAQVELDQEAAELERRLRLYMAHVPGTEAEEQLMRRWFVLVSRKSALIHRAHQLSLMEKEDDLKKKTEMLQEELRRVLSIEDFMKTDSDRRREELLLRDLVNLINERDDMVNEVDRHEQALAEDLQQERLAKLSAQLVSRDRSDKCILQ